MDTGDSPLSPETSATPRSGREGEQRAAERDADNQLSLGTALELRWDRATKLPTEWLESAVQQRDTCVEMRLRAVAHSRSQCVPVSPSTSTLSIAANAAAGSTWDLPASGNVVHVALMRELLLLGATDGVAPCEAKKWPLLVIVVSLQPRRSTRNPLALSFTLAVGSSLIRCITEKELCLDVPMSDQNGAASGSAQIRLRCGQTAIHWSEVVFVPHPKRPVDVHLSVVQLQRIVVGEQKSLDVVLEIAVTGQESRRAFRSRAWKLGESNEQIGVGIEALLHIDDAWTQAIRFTVVQHSLKERPHRLAEGFVTVSEVDGVSDQHRPIHVEMMTVGLETNQQQRRLTSTRRGTETDQTMWGDLKAAALIRSPTTKETTEKPRNAAALLSTGRSGYDVRLSDARGSLEIELQDAAIAGLAESSDTGGSLAICLAVTPGKWFAQAMAQWGPGKLPSRLPFDSELFAAPVRWTTKERVIPSLGCRVMLTSRSLHDEKADNPLPTSKTKAESHQKKIRTMTRLDGYQCFHLPVLFARPGEWIHTELCVQLKSSAQSEASIESTTLRLRVRFTTKEQSSADDSTSEEQANSMYCELGHLSVSGIQASGPFLKSFRPHDVFTVTLECSGATNGSSQPPVRSRGLSLEEATVAWTDPLLCELPLSTSAPIVVLKVFKVVSARAGDSQVEDQLVGLLSLPVPPAVLCDQHLVSFTLPLGDAATGLASETVHRKCGTVEFAMQFVATQHKRGKRETAQHLTLQRISWISTPPPLALTISITRQFSLHCELSVVSGKSLDKVLWQYTTNTVQAILAADASSASTEYVVNHSVNLSHQAIQKLSSAVEQCILIIKLSTREGDSQSIALGQTVIPVRNGWSVFVASEKDKWHKVYALGKHCAQGNPEPVGELQLSITVEEESTSRDDRGGREADGWLFVQVVEAVVNCRLDSTSAHIELQQNTYTKPQRSKPQWGTNGRWQWESDAIFVIPYVESANDEEGSAQGFSIAVVESGHRIEIGRALSVHSFVMASRSATSAGEHDADVDEWLLAPDGTAQLLLRLRYLPSVVGTLELEVLRLQPQCSGTSGQQLSSIPVNQLALRCLCDSDPSTIVKSPSRSVPPPGTDHWTCWGLVESDKLRLPVSFISLPPRPMLPSVKLQFIGASLGVQEMCLAEAAIPITSTVLSEGAPSTRWISLHARHDASQRVAISLVRFQFQRTTTERNARLLDTSAKRLESHEDWQRMCSSVLVLWKRIFYKLDVDRNGRIDVAEFGNLFVTHTQVFRETHDGEMLLRILQSSGGSSSERREWTVASVARLFSAIDRDDDKTIEWTEYVDFLQVKLLSLVPPPDTLRRTTDRQSEADLRQPETVEPAATRELRKKRREDPARESVGQTNPNGVASHRRVSVRQLRASSQRGDAVTNPVSTSQGDDVQLVAKLQTAEALLVLERQKSTRLQDELRSLRLAYHQLQLQQERVHLEDKTKESFLYQAIESHEEILRERAATRSRHHTASIVLQSKVRSRFEQKRFQALKLQRWHAARRLQCAYRCWVARRRFTVLQEADRTRKRQCEAASKLQRFVRFYLRRKERLLLSQARTLSAVVLQKYMRRLLAMRWRRHQLEAALVLQCWYRQLTAKWHVGQRREAITKLQHWLLGKLVRMRWTTMRRMAGRVQCWWRHANERRWEHLTLVEAAVCIQAIWRGNRHRQIGKGLDGWDRNTESAALTHTKPATNDLDQDTVAQPIDVQEGGRDQDELHDAGARDGASHAETGDVAAVVSVGAANEELGHGSNPLEGDAEQTRSDSLQVGASVFSVETLDDGDQCLPPEESTEDSGIEHAVSCGNDTAGIDTEIETITHALVTRVVECFEVDNCDPGRVSTESKAGEVADGSGDVLKELSLSAYPTNGATVERDSDIQALEETLEETYVGEASLPLGGEEEEAPTLDVQNVHEGIRSPESCDIPLSEAACALVDALQQSDADGEAQGIRNVLEEMVAAVEGIRDVRDVLEEMVAALEAERSTTDWYFKQLTQSQQESCRGAMPTLVPELWTTRQENQCSDAVESARDDPCVAKVALSENSSTAVETTATPPPQAGDNNDGGACEAAFDNQQPEGEDVVLVAEEETSILAETLHDERVQEGGPEVAQDEHVYPRLDQGTGPVDLQRATVIGMTSPGIIPVGGQQPSEQPQRADTHTEDVMAQESFVRDQDVHGHICDPVLGAEADRSERSLEEPNGQHCPPFEPIMDSTRSDEPIDGREEEANSGYFSMANASGSTVCDDGPSEAKAETTYAIQYSDHLPMTSAADIGNEDEEKSISNAESDDLMLLDAAAVADFRHECADPGPSSTQVTTAFGVDRGDSDKQLLLDLEAFNATPSNQPLVINGLDAQQTVVVADLD